MLSDTEFFVITAMIGAIGVLHIVMMVGITVGLSEVKDAAIKAEPNWYRYNVFATNDGELDTLYCLDHEHDRLWKRVCGDGAPYWREIDLPDTGEAK